MWQWQEIQEVLREGEVMEAFGCVGNTIKLASGGYLDLGGPQPSQFMLEDVAIGLSNICRFGGQIRPFYSVAAHSIACLYVAMDQKQSVECCKAVLMHDASEAFIGDVVKPLKIMLPNYRGIEEDITAAIAEKWSIRFDKFSDVISEIDHGMLIYERNKFFQRDGVEWAGEQEAVQVTTDLDGVMNARPDTIRVLFRLHANRLGMCD